MMKTYRLYLGIIIFSSALFVSCHNHSSHHEHADAHEAEEMHSDAHDHDHENHPGEVHFTKAQALACGLELEKITFGEFHPVLKASGEITSLPGAEKTLVSPSNGTVAFSFTPLIEGAEVKKGDVLFYISGGSLADGDQMAKAKAEYEAAKGQFLRAQTLAEDKIISQQEYEDIKMRYSLARASFESQAANYSENGMAVTSPQDGYILDLKAKAGQYVDTGEVLAVVAGNRKLSLSVDVPQGEYSFLREVYTANFKTVYDDALYHLSQINGRLLSLSRSAEGAFVNVSFSFDNTAGLLPGSFAQVFLIGKGTDRCLSVPVGAIIEEQGIKSVFVQEEEEIFHKKEIVLGRSDGERVEVLKGLSEGDKVVVKGAYNVKLATASSAIPGHTHNH